MKERKSGNHFGKVLLSHSHSQVLQDMEDALSGLSLVINTAMDGKSALDASLKENYFLVILDSSLPKVNGFEICRKVKELRGSKGPKVFLIVDREDLHGREKAFLCGCDGIITGPPDKETLLSQVMRLYSSSPTSFTHLLDDIRRVEEGEESGPAPSPPSQGLAPIDERTGLYSEEFFLQRAQEEFKRGKRHEHPLLLFFLEPAIGDRGEGSAPEAGPSLGIMQEISGKCLLEFRSEDILGVSGNLQKILFLFPETPPQKAQRIWEKILSLKKEIEGEEDIILKGGTAFFPNPRIETFNELVQACEEGLSKARQKIGNQYTPIEPAVLSQSTAAATSEGDRPPVPHSSLLAESLRLKSMLLSVHPSLETTLELVEHWAVRLGKKVGFSSEDVERLRAFARIFDIGLIGCSPALLEKPFLSAEEFEVFKNHVEVGARMAGTVLHDPGAEAVLRAHHENFDGSGYPLGLKGGEIPPYAQIIHLASFYTRLIEGTPYRASLPRDAACHVLQWKVSRLFEPSLATSLIQLAGNEDEEKAQPAERQRLVLMEGIVHKKGGEVYFDPSSRSIFYYGPPLMTAEENLTLFVRGSARFSIREMAQKINKSKKGKTKAIAVPFLHAEKTAGLIASLGWKAVPSDGGFSLEKCK